MAPFEPSAKLTNHGDRRQPIHQQYDLSIIGTAGLPAAYGGFETLAEHLVGHFATRRRIQVFCSTKVSSSEKRIAHYLNADLTYVHLKANGWQSTFYDAISLCLSARRSRVLLILGVSGCLFLPVIRLLAPRVRIVTNIDGIEWKRAKWGPFARAVLRASENVAVRFSDVVIADNKGIQHHVSTQYRRTSILIAYGGHPALKNMEQTSSDTRFAGGQYFLTICRIEPENNIHTILEAFRVTPSQRLVVVGNWLASKYGQEQRAHYENLPNIQMLDPIYERPRLAALRKGARGCIHGHSAGGTNPSLVEAMADGMAVLAHDVSYNRYTTDDKALYWTTAEDLASLLVNLTDDEVRRMAHEMSDIAARKYSWPQILAQYEAVLFS